MELPFRQVITVTSRKANDKICQWSKEARTGYSALAKDAGQELHMEWRDWYDALDKPSWTPEPSTIGLIWIDLPTLGTEIRLLGRTSHRNGCSAGIWSRRVGCQMGIGKMKKSRFRWMRHLTDKWLENTGIKLPEIVKVSRKIPWLKSNKNCGAFGENSYWRIAYWR